MIQLLFDEGIDVENELSKGSIWCLNYENLRGEMAIYSLTPYHRIDQQGILRISKSYSQFYRKIPLSYAIKIKLLNCSYFLWKISNIIDFSNSQTDLKIHKL